MQEGPESRVRVAQLFRESNFPPLREINRIAEWTKKYVHEAGAKGVVIGLSGGVDSALAAAIAVRGLGMENVLGVIIPCGSDPNDEIDAKAVAKWLGIRYTIVDLADPYGHFTNRIAPLVDATALTRANIKARLRMTVLYAFANEHNYLNMGTGNKSELSIGYITKYGDGGVDFEPLGEYYKGEVYLMAERIDVPKQVLDREPSAGLWEGQTDEDEIGMPYDLLDELLNVPESLRAESGNPDIERVNELIKKSEHKRHMPPSCPRFKE
jgi:NAD+ synthase